MVWEEERIISYELILKIFFRLGRRVRSLVFSYIGSLRLVFDIRGFVLGRKIEKKERKEL